MQRSLRIGSFGCVLFLASAALAGRLAYLDAPCDPYYVGREFPRLTTPQWVGEEGVEAVVVLAIDDMRDTAKYEAYLRPILDRLKKIDGRAPVSIMTNRIDPNHDKLKSWLDEGLSIEVHTYDHPCPCLGRGDFSAAETTYEKCVDLMASIPGNRPVAFRMPCCDSMNTPSPRFFAEIFNGVTAKGNFLAMDSSVFNVITPADREFPRELVTENGQPRFAKYLPWENFVNVIEDYPYPYVIAKLGWQFPCVVPSDWEAQHLHKPNNPQTVRDMQAALDATVIKQGVYNLVFHPHGWIRNDQINQLIDHAVEKHGRKVLFLTFPEALERINKNLLFGQPLRAHDGRDNGVRLVDVNHDGYLDVVIGNKNQQITRVYHPKIGKWHTTRTPAPQVLDNPEGPRNAGVRFGTMHRDGRAVMLVRNEQQAGAWHFQEGVWVADQALLDGLEIDGEPVFTGRDGIDQGVRLRDLDDDGVCELIVGRSGVSAVFGWRDKQRGWIRLPFELPKGTWIVDDQGRDAGLRFIDVDGDRHDDVVFSDDDHYSLHKFQSIEKGWDQQVLAEKRSTENTAIPPIVRNGQNNGAWFARGHMWVQNESTDRLPDKVDRRAFKDWLAMAEKKSGQSKVSNDSASVLSGIDISRTENIAPRTPAQSLSAMQTHKNVKIELVAAEPLVADPVAIDWGPDGRLWVAEMRDYPNGLDGKGKPGGRVKFLTDTDGDGRYDRATVFLDNVPFPTGVKVWRKGILVTAAPQILYAEDTDGDGQADIRRTLYEGFVEGNQQHRVNGLRWGLDNWLYVGNGDSGGKIRSTKSGQEVSISRRDLRIRPDSGRLDAQSGSTQFGINRDDWGNWFGGNNSNPIWHYVLRDDYLRRNSHLAPPDVRKQVSVQPGASRIYPISRVLERFNNPNSAGRFTSACSPMIYRDVLLGKEFAGNAFICEPVHNMVHRELVDPEGVTFTSRRAPEDKQAEFLASRDNWFRPAMIRTGPDGCLWVVDMYRFVIEHPKWIPQSFQARLDLRAGDRLGRIYRIVPSSGTPRPIKRLNQMKATELVAELDSPNAWQRDMVHQMLLWKNDPATDKQLTMMATTNHNPLARLHALCVLDGLGRLTPKLVDQALLDEHAGVRRHAIRLAEGLLDDAGDLLGPALLKLAGDKDLSKDPQVQLQLAYSLGVWKDPRAAAALAQMATSHIGDAYLTAAVLSSVNKTNIGQVLASLLTGGNDRKPSTALLERLLPMAVALGDIEGLSAAFGKLVPHESSSISAAQLRVLGSLASQLRRSQTKFKEARVAKAVEQIFSSLSDFAKQARGIASDEEADLALRVAAIELLGSLPSISTDADLYRDLLQPQQPTELQQSVVKAMGQRNEKLVPELLLDGWQSHTPAIRSRVADLLMGRREWTEALVAELEQGRIRMTHLDTRRRGQLANHRDPAIRSRAGALLAKASSGSRAALVKQYHGALAKPGNAEQGKLLFKKHCGNCHRLHDVGHQVGPDLAALTNRSPQALLVAMLDPNRAVEEKYLDYAVITTDGRTSTGMLAAETSTSITLQGPEKKQIVILRNQIDLLRATGKSMMPEGFEKDLKPADVADLIAYLGTIGPPSKSFSGNHPQTVQRVADGSLALLATNCRIFGKSIVFEKKYKNLGYWSGQQDHAVWTVELKQPGTFEVQLDYACDQANAGNRYVIDAAGSKLTGTVASTASWELYRQKKIGKLTLPAGKTQVVFRPDGAIRGALIDLVGLRLTPTK